MTELIRRKQSGEAWETVVDNGGSARVLGPFPFAFDTPGIEDGVEFYTPTVNDIMLDAWIEITQDFDGTTPQADIGSFVGATNGIWGANNGAIDLSAGKDDDTSGGAGYAFSYGISSKINSALALGGINVVTVTPEVWRSAPGRFTAANPLKLVISQDGLAGGAAVGGTTGAVTVYVVIATPSLT